MNSNKLSQIASYVKNPLFKRFCAVPGLILYPLSLFFFYILLKGKNYSLSDTQYCVFVVFISALFFVRWGQLRLKYFVLIASVLFFSGYTILRYSSIALRNTDYVIASLAEDRFDAQGSIYLHKVAKKIEDLPDVRIGRVYSDISNVSEAQKILKSKSASAIVWGNLDWINVSFERTPNKKILPLKIKNRDFSLIRHIPTIGFDFKPIAASTEFLSLLVRSETDNILDKKSYLRSAALYKSQSNTYAYLAYPYFVLGNTIIEEYISSGSKDKGELSCAIEAYTTGASHLQPGDNPNLRASLFSNKVLANFLLNGFNKTTKSSARSTLKKALAISQRDDPYQAKSNIKKIVLKNLEILTNK